MLKNSINKIKAFFIEKSKIEILGLASLTLGFLLLLTVGWYYISGRIIAHNNLKMAQQFHGITVEKLAEGGASVDTNGDDDGQEIDFDWSAIDNDDLLGWVYIPDTTIDYPVLQTDNNEYYLNHGYDKKYTGRGAIFMDKGCNASDYAQSLVLYGHHMKDGGMFAGLDKFKDREYASEHDRIYMYYPQGGKETFQVVGAFYWDEGGSDFPYYEYFDMDDEIQYDIITSNLLNKSIYGKTELLMDTIDYGTRRFIMLSTCDYRTDNSRFVLVGAWVNE